MPRPPIDLTRKIKDILQHHGPLPPEAEIPLAHFERSVADVWNMLLYFERFQVKGSVLAAHFRQGTSGRSLGESETWLDCRDINDRFRAEGATHNFSCAVPGFLLCFGHLPQNP